MLSVIAVNYNSASLLKECYDSIASTADTLFEFIAVDSGSAKKDIALLHDIKGPDISIILNSENIGYAKAVNAGIKNARGDLILITNPDVIYMPGSIRAMSNALSELTDCGAAGPKTWWNQGRTFLLPFSELITPYWVLRSELMKVSGTVLEAALKSWTEKSLKYWLSENPLRQEMLSGACIMTNRKVLEMVGGFDENFPLYFEDTDWCLRVRKAGLHLYMLPEAGIVHYYNQSAKKDVNASRKKYDFSFNKYMEKHFRKRFYAVSLLQKLITGNRNILSGKYYNLGNLAAPPYFDFKDASEKLLLLSPVETLVPSSGAVFSGRSFKIPEDLWEQLGEGRYFVKVIGINTFLNYGMWSWDRTLPI